MDHPTQTPQDHPGTPQLAPTSMLVIPMRIRAQRSIYIAIAVMFVGVFLLDIFLRLGVATGVLYVPVILLSLFIWNIRVTITAAIVATVLTWLAYAASPSGGAVDWVSYINRTFSTVAIWAVAGLSLTGIRQSVKLNAQKIANLELTRSNSELEQFASIASHDLQAPIRKVAAFTDRLIDSDPPLSERQQEFVERIQTASGRMQTLISDLLSYSRISTRDNSLYPVDLNESVERACEDLEEDIRDSGAAIEVEDLPTVEANTTQMAQLFQNLIGNAIKYRSADRKPMIRISGVSVSNQTTEADSLSSTVVEKFCEIRIKDNGIGFSQEFSHQIFEIFKRLHGPGEYEGTGIGLALCKKIVEKHYGTIRAESVPGIGTEFILRLPAHQMAVDRVEGVAA